VLSVSRIFLSFALLFVEPLSDIFLIILAAAFVTDVFDGYLARRWHVESTFGSRMDSLGDLIMMVILMVVLLINIEFKDWMIFLIVSVLVIRSSGFIIGVIRFKQLAFVHTLMNKLTTLFIVLSPFFLRLFGLDVTVVVVGGVALVAAIEYLYVNATSKEYDPDRRSAFF